MHGKDVPYFAEYLQLAGKAGMGELVNVDEIEVGFKDALIVLDMQNDHLPVTALNPQGGAMGVDEGCSIVPLVVDLMDQFSTRGGMVLVTRDYHPISHCSFIDEGGRFPAHCVQGTVGADFYQPVGECLHRLRQSKFSEGRAEVVFKGFHENVDSLSAFEHPEAPGYTRRSSGAGLEDDGHLEGTALLSDCSAAWTGASVLKSSNSKYDVNAPPDVLASQRRVKMSELLRKRGIRRVFLCGLSLDNSVAETAANAANAGFSDINVILDATRAQHLPGIGEFGTGFMQDPAVTRDKLVNAGVRLVPVAAILPNLERINPVNEIEEIKQGFPSKLGPFALVRAKKISLYVDREKRTFRAVAPLPEIRSLEAHDVAPEGTIATVRPLTLDDDARKRAGIPASAAEFTWAYPVGAGTFADQARAYFSITTPSAAFFVYGGFIYFDKVGRVVGVMAISLGRGLNFESPLPWPREYTMALEDRWHPVTAPFLRERGARLFVWINPGERIEPMVGGEPWRVSDHGAFVYLFHEDLKATDERDAVYAVSQDEVETTIANIGRVGFEMEDVRAARMVRNSLGIGTGEATACVMSAFQEWDVDGSGTINEDELAEAMKSLDPNLSDATISRLFKAADVNRNGVIEFEEFVKWVYGHVVEE